MISFSQARELNKKGNVIPLSERIPSDLETPVSAFIKLTTGKQTRFLLESVEGGEKLARYSFVGFDPFLVVEGSTDEVRIRKGRRVQNIKADPRDFIRELFRVYRPVHVEDLPRFTGGAVGYFSYDSARWVERIPDNNPDEINMPDMLFGLYSHIVVFDHLKQEMIIVANILHDHGEPGFRKKYDAARRFIGATVKRLNRPIRASSERQSRRKASIIPCCSRSEFESMVRAARKYIKEGDILQVVLSQRWLIESSTSALSVYRRLRRINPSPYMFLLDFGSDSIIGSSPEMMVRVEQGQIETRPIAGTRPRGKNTRADEKQIADLLNDPKELAEHTMLLDLGRNDIGRVSRAGSVAVKEQMIIEKYSHVIHIVSSVTGRLRKGVSPLDGHFACFPAGTVSGAPKIRAMEIIDELERHRRGVYGGSIAYLDFWGNLDSCIAIRTVVKKETKFYVQAGAGIVADSSPRREYNESAAKASAIIEAVTG
ncbi:MAG: anthranilate synthase component I [Candidatus Zixiibacteriota bacterium]|nr:MAG: anthranilate synthase component I [candidate division Zixibacteria bacterium]